MKKVSKIAIAFVLFTRLSMASQPPLILANNNPVNGNNGTTAFTLTFSNSNTPQKQIFLQTYDKWKYTLQPNESLLSIRWKYYSLDEYTPRSYLLDVQKTMPPLAQGGTVVIFKEGKIMYDEKKGEVHFRKADDITNINVSNSSQSRGNDD